MGLPSSLPATVELAIREVRTSLLSVFGNRLKQVILFGSYARGDYAAGSDIDLVLLLDKIEDPDVERDRYLPVAFDASLKYDVVVSIVAIAHDKYLSGRTPLILNLRREGITT